MNWTDRHSGMNLVSLGRYGQAEELARSAIVIDAADAEAYELLATALWGLKQMPEALAAADRARALAPRSLSALLVRGGALLAIGDWKSCLEQCDEALEIVPDHAATFRLRGRAHQRSTRLFARIREDDRRDLDRATSLNRSLVLADLDLTRAVALDPVDEQNHVAMANFELRNRWWNAAYQSAHQALAINPNHADAHVIVGRVSEEVGDLSAASESFVRAGRQGDSSRSLAGLVRVDRLAREERGPTLPTVTELSWRDKSMRGGLFLSVYGAVRILSYFGAKEDGLTTSLLLRFNLFDLLAVAFFLWLFVVGPHVARWRERRLAPEKSIAPEAQRVLGRHEAQGSWLRNTPAAQLASYLADGRRQRRLRRLRRD